MADSKLLPKLFSFRHECEEVVNFKGEADNQSRFNNCKKNPGHKNFIPVSDLKKHDLPPKFQTENGMAYIQETCNRIVKLFVSYTSHNRPGTDPASKHGGSHVVSRNGTGLIEDILTCTDKPCPCKECKTSGCPKVGYVKIKVHTARHVVCDELEACGTECECFYDRPDKDGVKTLYGVGASWTLGSDSEHDVMVVHCVSHHMDVIDKLNTLKSRHFTLRPYDLSCKDKGFTVSHPHGVHKHISFGLCRYSIFDIFPVQTFSNSSGYVKCRLKRNSSSIKQAPDSHSQCEEEEGKDNNTEEDEIYLEKVTSPSPGKEYLLPTTSTIFIPSYPDDDDDDGGNWIELLEGTGYTNSKEDFVLFPQGMEILAELDENHAMLYDIPTCPGSSGAPVMIYNYTDGLHAQGIVHCGGTELGNQGFAAFFTV